MAGSQQLRTLYLDKVASTTLNCHVSREVKVGDDFPCMEGDVLALRVVNEKTAYNTLELTTGRMSPLIVGDIAAGVLGHRSASQGHAGHVPSSIRTGDEIHLLNLGGVVGACTSSSPAVGPPIRCTVLGQVLGFPFLGHRVGVPENIARETPPLDTVLRTNGVPVVAVVGTSMNSGKTEACLKIIQQMAHQGLSVAAGKATGVSLRRDILAMEDAGASSTAIFTDLGVVTTQALNAPQVTVSLLNRLAAARPDIIVLELGDGLFGSYGVDAVLSKPEIAAAFRVVVLAASDPVAAWGGAKVLREQYQITPTVVTGPATDNEVGVGIIRARTGIESINARMDSVVLSNYVMKVLGAMDG